MMMYETVEKVLTCWLQARMGSEAELYKHRTTNKTRKKKGSQSVDTT